MNTGDMFICVPYPILVTDVFRGNTYLGGSSAPSKPHGRGFAAGSLVATSEIGGGNLEEGIFEAEGWEVTGSGSKPTSQRNSTTKRFYWEGRRGTF